MGETFAVFGDGFFFLFTKGDGSFLFGLQSSVILFIFRLFSCVRVRAGCGLAEGASAAAPLASKAKKEINQFL